MNTTLTFAPCWSTSSFGEARGSSLTEQSALGEHLHVCNQSHGRLFALRCGADLLHGFVAPRLVTTLLAVGLLTGIASLLN